MDLNENNYVCELHFHARDVKKQHEIQTQNGKTCQVQKRLYSLRKGAIPTLQEPDKKIFNIDVRIKILLQAL